MLARKSLVALVLSCIIAAQVSLGTCKKFNRPKELTIGMHPPSNVMNGNVKVEQDKDAATGGDAPKEAAGKEELIDKQPSGQNTTESGEPPRYPINVESAEAQAHESRITGCRDHPDVGKVCAKAKDPCFCAEHESYTFSYCRKSCKFCNPKMKTYNKFWRLRAGNSFNPSWMISNVEFYRARGLNETLTQDSSMAYSSSNYDPGFSAAKAFDKDPSSMWMPDGWDSHSDNTDWLAYEFAVPVHIASIKLDGAIRYPKAAPSKIYVEAADEKYGPFETKWMIRNPDFATAKVFSFIECDVLYRRYETGEDPVCIRLIAKYKNWMEARKECQLEGGELASITSKEEYDFILQDVRLCGFTWVGLNDREQEGNYVWSDSASSNFTKWKSNQAYDEVQRHYEDCVAMDPDGNWFTFSCQDKFYFLCKKTLVDPPNPIEQEPPASMTPEIQFVAPNFSTPVVGADAESEEEAMTDDEKFKETLASIAMSRMKELGLKPPEAVANLEFPPPDLGEQLHNLTEIALKNSNEKKIDKDMEKEQKPVPAPPGRQKPKMQTSKGGKPSPSKHKGLTIIQVPTSPGQELIDDIPGVPELNIPGEEEEEDKDADKKKNKKKPGKQQKAKPPPAQEGQPGDSELSIGESGDEGPVEGQVEDQETEELPKNQPKPKKIKPKKKKANGAGTKEATKPDNNTPEYPPELKNPPLPSKPSVPPKQPKPSQNFLGKISSKKHNVANKKTGPFSITFAGKQVMNVQQKHAVSQASSNPSAEQESQADEATEQNFSDKEEDSEPEEVDNTENETEKTESEIDESGSQSGSGLAGFDPNLEEEFLDLDVDDLLL